MTITHFSFQNYSFNCFLFSLSLNFLSKKMGMLPCPNLPFQSNKEPDADHNLYDSSKLYPDSLSNSLYSQPSLPSVPSLTPPSNYQLEFSSNTATNHHQCLATLKGHSSYVFSLALDGNNRIYSGSDSQIRLWTRNGSNYASTEQDSATNNYNVVASSHSAVKSIVILGDNLFSAHHDHKIRVWKIENDDVATSVNQKYKCVANLPTLNDRLMRLFSPDNYVEVRRHKKRTWVHHVDTVSALSLSKDGSLLYSVSWDRTLKIWRTSDFKCLESVRNAHDDAINSVAVSEDGFIYTGSADRKIKVWKKRGKKHELVDTLEKHRSAVNALALSPDGSLLYSGACDRSIIVWERDSGGGQHMVVAGALRGHSKAILCLAVVADLVCSGSADKTIRIWRRVSEKNYYCLGVLEGHRGPVKCLVADYSNSHDKDSNSGLINPGLGNSYLVYSGSLDCDVKIWQILVDNI